MSDKKDSDSNSIRITDYIGIENGPAIYRRVIGRRHYFSWLVSYKNSDLFISSDKNIKDKISLPLKNIYSKLEYCIKRDAGFLNSLLPLKPKSYYPEEIKIMCRESEKFNVGPMAAVAGTVNDYLAQYLLGHCNCLIIENGGDLFIKSGVDTVINLYLENSYFKNSVNIKIKSIDTPCGICSSSGTFGHSFSMGKCDLATIISKSSAVADAAATAAANSVVCENDIAGSVDYFRTFEDICGILLIKDKKIGMWGNFQLLE